MAPSKNFEAVNEDKCDDNTQDEDIKWLASLTEHELDFLISLKDLAAIRAQNLGHKKLIQKFDLKVLRGLAYVLLEYFKDRVRNTLDVPADKLLGSLSGCGLLDLNCDGNPDTVTPASISPTKDVNFVSSKRKKMWDGQKRLAEDLRASPKKKIKKGDRTRRRKGEGRRTETNVCQAHDNDEVDGEGQHSLVHDKDEVDGEGQRSLVHNKDEVDGEGQRSLVHDKDEVDGESQRSLVHDKDEVYGEDLPHSTTTSPLFNVSDLSAHNGDATDMTELEVLPFNEQVQSEEIKDVVDVRNTHTRHGIHRRYLVQWSGRPFTDCTWIDASELMKRRPDIFHRISEVLSSRD